MFSDCKSTKNQRSDHVNLHRGLEKKAFSRADLYATNTFSKGGFNPVALISKGERVSRVEFRNLLAIHSHGLERCRMKRRISSYCCFGPFHVSSNHVIQRTEGSDFSHRFDQFLKRGFPLNSMRANFSAKSYVGVKVRKFMQERKQEKWWRKVFIDRNNGAFESEITPF